MASRAAIHIRALVFASVIMVCLYVGPNQHSHLHNRRKRALSVGSAYNTEDSPSSPIAQQVKSTLNVVAREANAVPVISLSSEVENLSLNSLRKSHLFSDGNDPKKHMVNNKSTQNMVISNRRFNNSVRESNVEQLINASTQLLPSRYTSTSYSNSSSTIEMDTRDNHSRPKKRHIRSSHNPKTSFSDISKPNRHINDNVIFDTKSIVVKLQASTLLRKNIIALLGSMLFSSKTTISEELYISLLNIYDAFRTRRLHTLEFIHILAEMMHKPLQTQFAVFFHELEKHSPEYLKWDVMAWRAITFGNMSDVKELVTLELSKQQTGFLSGIDETDISIVQTHTVFTQSTVDDSIDWVVSITGNFYANIIGIITEGKLIMTKELFVYVMLQLPCETFSPELEETRSYIADVLLNEENYHFEVKYTQIQTEREPDPYKLIQSVLTQIKIQIPKDKSFEELLASIDTLISFMVPPRLLTKIKGTENSFNVLTVNYTEAFNIVTLSEFPVDVVQCKNDLLLFIQNNHLYFSSIMKISEMYKIKSSRELLIALLSKFRRNLNISPNLSSCINTLRSHIIRKYDLWEKYSYTKSDYNRKSLILEAFQSPYLPKTAYNITTDIISKLDREYPSWQNESDDITYQTPPRYYFLKLALSIYRNKKNSGWSNIQASLNDFIDYFNTLQTVHIQCRNECSDVIGRSLPLPSAVAHGYYKSNITTDKNNSLYNSTTVPALLLHKFNTLYTVNPSDELEETLLPSVTNGIETTRQKPIENQLKVKEISYDPFYLSPSVSFTQEMSTSHQFDHGNGKFHTNGESNRDIESSSISANNMETYPSSLTETRFSKEINQEYTAMTDIPHKGLFAHSVPTTLYEDSNHVRNIITEEPEITNSNQPLQNFEMNFKNESYIVSMGNETLRSGAIKLIRKLCEIAQQCLTPNQDELNGTIKLCNVNFEEKMLGRLSSLTIKMLIQSLPRNSDRDKIHILEMFLNSPNISQMLGDKFIMTNFPTLKQLMSGLLKHSLTLSYIRSKSELYDALEYFDKALTDELNNSQHAKENKTFTQNMYTVSNDTDSKNNVTLGYNFLNLNDYEFDNSLFIFNLPNSTDPQQLKKLITFLGAMNISDSMTSCCNRSPGFVFKTMLLCIIHRSLTLDSDKIAVEHVKTLDYFHRLLYANDYTNYSKALTNTDAVSLLSELPFSSDNKNYTTAISLLLNPYCFNNLGTSFNASLYNSTKELLTAIINHCLSLGSLQSEPNLIESLHSYDNLLQDSPSNIKDHMLFNEPSTASDGSSLIKPNLNSISQMNTTVSEFELKGIIKQEHEMLSVENNSELREVIMYYHELLELQDGKGQKCVIKLLNETSLPTLTETENKSTMFPNYRHLLQNIFLEAIRMKYVKRNSELLNNLYECRIFLNSSFLENQASELTAAANNSVSSNANVSISEEITKLSFDITTYNTRYDSMKDTVSRSSAEEAVVRNYTSPIHVERFELFENNATTIMVPIPENLSEWSYLQDKNSSTDSRHFNEHKTMSIIPDHSYEEYVGKLKDELNHYNYTNEQVSHNDANASLNTEAIETGGRNLELKPKSSFSGKKMEEENYITEVYLSNLSNFKPSNNEKAFKLEEIVDDKGTHDTPLYNGSSLYEVHSGAGLDTNTFQEFETDNKIDKKRNLYRTSITPRTKQDYLHPFTFRTMVQNISLNGMEEGMKINLLFGSKHVNKHPNKQYIFNKQSPTLHPANKARENNDTFRNSNNSTVLLPSGGVNTTAKAKANTTKIPVDPVPFDDISKKWYYKGRGYNETSESPIEIKAYSDGNGADNLLHATQSQILSPYTNFTGIDKNKSEGMNNNLSFYFPELAKPNDMLSEQRIATQQDHNVQNTNNVSVNSRFQEFESGIDSSMLSKSDDMSDLSVNKNMKTYRNYVNNSHNELAVMQSVGFHSNNLKAENIGGMNSSSNYFENKQVDVNFSVRTDEIKQISSPQIMKYSDMSNNVHLSRINIDDPKDSKDGLGVGQSESNATELYIVTDSFPNMEQQSIGLYGLNVNLSLSSTQSSPQHNARIIETTSSKQQANSGDYSTESNDLDTGLKNLFSSLNPRYATNTQIFTTPLSTSHNEISISKKASELLSRDSNEYQAKIYFTGIINTTSSENLFDGIAYKMKEKEFREDDKEPSFNQSTNYEYRTSSDESDIHAPNEIFAKTYSKNISYSKEIEHVSHDHKYTNATFPDRDALLCLNSTDENCKHNNNPEKESFYNENTKSYTHSTRWDLSPYATHTDITGETAIDSDLISQNFTSFGSNPVERSNAERTDSLDSGSKEAVDHNMSDNISATENTYYNNQGSTRKGNLSDTIPTRSIFIASTDNYTTPRLHKMKNIGAKRKHSKANSILMRKNDTEAIPRVILYHLYIHGSKIIQKQVQNTSTSLATTAFIKAKSRAESNTSEVFEKENENNDHKIFTGATTNKIDFLYVTESREATAGNIYFTTKVADTDIFNEITKRPIYIGTASNLTDENREIHNEIYERFNEINSTLNNDTDDVLAAAKVSFRQYYQEVSNVTFFRNEGKGKNEINKDSTIQQTVPNKFHDSSVQYNKQYEGNENNYTEKIFFTKTIQSNEILDNTSVNDVSKSKNSLVNDSQTATPHISEYLYSREVPRSSNSTSHQIIPYGDRKLEYSPDNISPRQMTTELTTKVQGIFSVPAFNSTSTFSVNGKSVTPTNVLTEISKVSISSSPKPIETDDDILNSLNADKLNLLGTNGFWLSNSEGDRSAYQFSTSVTHYDDERIAQIRNVSLVLREILKTSEGRRLKILMNFLRKPDLVQSLGPSFKVANFPSFRLLLQGIIDQALEVINTQYDVKLMETLQYYKKLLEN